MIVSLGHYYFALTDIKLAVDKSTGIDYNIFMTGDQHNYTRKIADFGKALADPTRQRIMQLCCCQWRNVGELVDLTGLAQSTVSHHLAKLSEYGLVHVRHEGKMAFYVLNQEAISRCCSLSAEVFAPEVDRRTR